MSRLDVLKTYKIYIGGQFPRTESGRFYPLKNKNGSLLANVCLSSRKDFRNAVVAARSAFAGWSNRAGFNRGQIVYRIAEMLESRKEQFVEELVREGSTIKSAQNEVLLAIDCLVYYAGWCDKYQTVSGTINPVSSSHFNFSISEPMGVVAVIAPEQFSLIGIVSAIVPVIAGGNTCVVLASNTKPLCAVTFAETLHSSDVPTGVVNILTGSLKELHEHFASHMDVNSLVYHGRNPEIIKKIRELSSLNVKRVFVHEKFSASGIYSQGPYPILETQEIKTTWHPIEQIGEGKAGY